MISIIAALSQNNVIGENNRVPWKIKEDLVRLKNLTKDQIVIVGRKTYDSMADYYQKSGRPMPGKVYIIVTHNPTYKPVFANTEVVDSLEKAIYMAKTYSSSDEPKRGVEKLINEIFIIGGAQIFTQAMSYVDKLYLTIVHTDIAGDAFFPDYTRFKKIVSKEERFDGNYHFTFLELTPQN